MKQNAGIGFGKRIKSLRLAAKETLADVSDAVEVDVEKLAEIETGKLLPTDDLILLLISHFKLTGLQAQELWGLSGYPQAKNAFTDALSANKDMVQVAFISPADVKVIYSDLAHVNANSNGLVINFLQGFGDGKHSMAVSRIGMSHEHAKNLIKALQQTIRLTRTDSTQDKKRDK